MSEIQDLKNIIMALNSKLNSFFEAVKGSSQLNEKTNEILNLIHNLGFERSKINISLFENIFPDMINRLAFLEEKDRLKGKYLLKPGKYFDISFGKRKNQQLHFMITESGFKIWMDYHKLFDVDLFKKEFK